MIANFYIFVKIKDRIKKQMLPLKSYYRFKTGCIQYKEAKPKYKNIIAIR